MKFLGDLIGFGPNLILGGENTERFPVGDDKQNCLSLRCSLGRQ
jgi:hypothetical protein